MAQAWDALAHAGSLSPTADAIWYRSALTAFGELRDELAIHCLYDRGELAAVVPLRRSGRLVLSWASVFNVHWPFWTMAIDRSRGGAICEVLDHLLEGAICIELILAHSQEFPCQALIAAAKSRGCAVALDGDDGDLYIPLSSDPERTWSAIPSKMRRETRRKARQLEQRGALEYERVAGGPHLQDELEECFRLERLGWKGKTGSPIAADPQTHRFYSMLACESAAAGRFALDLLRLDGRMIAYEISIRGQGRIDMLKPSFDPAYARYSPGNVLRLKILACESELGEVHTYHLGRPSEWKRHWVRNTRPLCRVRIYRPGWLGFGAYLVGPWVRGTAKHVSESLGLRQRAGAQQVGGE